MARQGKSRTDVQAEMLKSRLAEPGGVLKGAKRRADERRPQGRSVVLTS
jgi:hypothetical protein